jgi:hypothetical protein
VKAVIFGWKSQLETEAWCQPLKYPQSGCQEDRTLRFVDQISSG